MAVKKDDSAIQYNNKSDRVACMYVHYSYGEAVPSTNGL